MVKISSLSKLHALLLLQRPCHGYALMQRVSPSKKASAGEIYPFLQALKKQGYAQIQQKGAREKKTYVLTAKGKTLLRTALGKLDGFFIAALKEKIKSCTRCGCKIYAGTYRKERKVYCCIYCARGE